MNILILVNSKGICLGIKVIRKYAAVKLCVCPWKLGDTRLGLQFSHFSDDHEA